MGKKDDPYRGIQDLSQVAEVHDVFEVCIPSGTCVVRSNRGWDVKGCQRTGHTRKRLEYVHFCNLEDVRNYNRFRSVPRGVPDGLTADVFRVKTLYGSPALHCFLIPTTEKAKVCSCDNQIIRFPLSDWKVML